MSIRTRGIPLGVDVHYLVIGSRSSECFRNTRFEPVQLHCEDLDFKGQVIPSFRQLRRIVDDSQLMRHLWNCASADKVVVAGQELPYSTFRAIQYNVGYANIEQLYFLTQPLGDNHPYAKENWGAILFG